MATVKFQLKYVIISYKFKYLISKMGLKNNTKYFRMRREYQMRCSRLSYYQQALKEEEQYFSIYQKALNKFKIDNPAPSETIMRQFNAQFTRGKNDQMIRFYTTKISNLQKL
tara:strand:+ start:3412 stop:3747 length:336 start_codon:yes stop_codon:yes gene_type:complete